MTETTATTSAHVDTFTRDHLPPPEQWPTMEFTTQALQYPTHLNVGVELVDVTADRIGAQAPALRTPAGQVWTYGELRRRSDQIAQGLVEDIGLVPGNRVLLRSPNNPWTVAAWVGVLKAGGVVVTTMAALRARELAPIIDRTRPIIALVDPRFSDDVQDFELTVLTYEELEQQANAKSGDFTAVATAADDVALLGPTSGSTGDPKITMHFHRDLLAINDTFGATLGLGPADLVACTAPLAFTFGLGMLTVFPLRAGACAMMTELATPAELADIVAEHRVTVLATAPTAYKQILKSGKIEQLRSLRAAVSAGEHIPQSVWEQIRDAIGLEIIDGIGSTELLHIFISTIGQSIRPGSTGKPLPGYRATVLGVDGQPVAPGEEGQLAVIGPVGVRYLDDQRQAAYVVNGWNVTGDTFRMDEDGYFYYCARTDNMIVSSGYNIGGPEVEAAIDDHPDVVESAVVAEPDAERGSIVCAFVVLAQGVPGDAPKAKELQDFVKQQLAPYKYPRDVRFVDALPRNASGKLQHFRLREILEAHA